jgi:nitrate/nitrite transporter NarK
MTAVILRIAMAFGVWLLSWILVVPLLLLAAVIALRDMTVEALRKRREKKQIAEQVEDFARELQEWR